MERRLQEILLMVITAVTAVVLSIFTTIRVLAGDWFLASFDATFLVAMILAFVYVARTRETKKAKVFVAVSLFPAMLVTLLVNGFASVLWAYPVAIGAFYLFSHKTAIVINSVFAFLIGLLIYPESSTVEVLTVIASLSITVIMGFFFSYSTQEHQKNQINSKLLLKMRNQSLELIAKTSDLKRILDGITESIESEYPEMLCSILLLDKSGQHLLFGAGRSLPDFYNQAIDGVGIGEGVGSCGTAAYRAERVIVNDIHSHPFWQDYKGLAAQAELAACWSEPILNGKGQVLGTFAIYHRTVRQPTNQDFLLIEQFANLASIAIERDNDSQLIWQQANFDHLTGLPNRNMMQAQLQKALLLAKREQTKLAIVFIDLDNFKDINDSLGHDAGDALLIEAGKRIRGAVRENDTIARFGGDEFVLLLEGIEGQQGIEKVANKLLVSLAKPYQLKGQEAYSSASIGVTVFPDDGNDLELLLKNADQAMYGAKQCGRNNIFYFTESMRIEMLNRTSMVKDLRNALERQQLFFVFQPIIDLKSGKIAKAEVLLRWRHPEHGLISPQEFIPLAEDTGLIIDFSDWLFREVAPLVRDWRKHYNPDFQLSINTSPVQYKSGFANITKWVDWLAEYGLTEQALAFEITENLLMESDQSVYQIISDIQRAGVNISIDDFGIGYSSFGYLKKYPTDYIKIDKSFVQRISESGRDLALCEAIVVMAKKMSMKVIAEGVETQAQGQILKDIGCDFAQGYYFAKPLPLEEFELLLNKGCCES